MKRPAVTPAMLLILLLCAVPAFGDSYINWHTDYMPGMGTYDTGLGSQKEKDYVEICIPAGPVAVCADNTGCRSAYIHPGVIAGRPYRGYPPHDSRPSLPLLGPILGGIGGLVGRLPLIQPYPGPFPILDAVGNDVRYLFPWVWLQPEAWSETWPQP